MPYSKLKLILSLVPGLLLSLFAVAQTANLQFNPEKTKLPRTFYQIFDKNLPIAYGRVFTGYSPQITGSPFFNGPGWTDGKVVFDNVTYEHLKLQYDVYANELIVKRDENLPYILSAEKIAGFTLGELSFIKIAKDNSWKLPPGFYQLQTNGPVQQIAARKKILKEIIEDSRIKKEFITVDEFYGFDEEQMIPIKNKKALFQLVKDKKALIRKELKGRNLSFKNNREAFITTAIEIYNQ